MAVRTWSYPAAAAAFALVVLASVVVGRLGAQQPGSPQQPRASLWGPYSSGDVDNGTSGIALLDSVSPLAQAPPPLTLATVLASSSCTGMQAVAVAPAAADLSDAMALIDVHEDGAGAGKH